MKKNTSIPTIYSYSGGEQTLEYDVLRHTFNCSFLVCFRDEPTVGVDPVLRQIIWRHLRELSTRGTTVIISTHYMEECSKADKVCFLRKGKVVGLGKPEILKEQYLVASLDDVFFKMCESDEDQGKVECNNKPEKALISIESADEEEYNPFLGATNFQDLDGLKMKTKEVRLWETFKALLFKNFMVLRRHGGFLVFNIFMPLVCFLMFLTCIGSTIRGLKLGIVNEEMGIGGCLEPEEISCPDLTDLGELYFNGLDLGPNLSCHVISNLDPFVMGKQTERTLEDARTAVVMSQDNGYLHFEQGFSEALSARLYAIITSSNITGQLLDLSEIKMSLDATNIEVARAMQISALKSVHGFFIDYSKTCNLTLVEEYISHLGISVHPIRPDVEPTTNLAKGMLPAVMVMILNMLAMALTADQLATEREEGLFQRDFVCGVSVSLILLSQMCAQLTVVVGEIVCSLILLAVVFPTLAWHFFFFLFFLFLIQAIVGMTLGFFITTLCKTRDQVMFLGSFCVFPTFILSGIIWPRIAMPEVLQVLSVFLPITLTGDVAKYVVVNQTYDAPNFWWGIIIPIIWSIGQFIVCLIIQASTVISNPDVIKYKLKRKK